jgi:hypothetical protein
VGRDRPETPAGLEVRRSAGPAPGIARILPASRRLGQVRLRRGKRFSDIVCLISPLVVHSTFQLVVHSAFPGCGVAADQPFPGSLPKLSNTIVSQREENLGFPWEAATMRPFIGALALAGAVANGWATPGFADSSPAYFGAGTQTCGFWLNRPEMTVSTSGWILGYWSGLNEQNPINPTVGYSMGGNKIVEAVKRTCASNVSQSVVTATMLTFSLVWARSPTFLRPYRKNP